MVSQRIRRYVVRLMLLVSTGVLPQAVVTCDDESLVINLPDAVYFGDHGHDDGCYDCGGGFDVFYAEPFFVY